MSTPVALIRNSITLPVFEFIPCRSISAHSGLGHLRSFEIVCPQFHSAEYPTKCQKRVLGFSVMLYVIQSGSGVFRWAKFRLFVAKLYVPTSTFVSLIKPITTKYSIFRQLD